MFVKNIIKLTGMVALIVFSFFYTDKVVTVVRDADPLMNELEKVSDVYNIEAINGKIDKKTIIPGMNGRKINIEKSYKKMHQEGVFNKNLIEYDIVKPKISLLDNRNKFIIKGNNNKQMVSIVFILKDDKYLEKLENIVTSKEVVINYFVTYEYLVSNSTNISKMENREFYNYGNDGVYTPDNILFANNLISRITNNEAIYCLTKDKSSKVLKLCSSNDLFTISPNIIINNNPYQEVKDNISSGSIILMEINNDTTTEIAIIIDYIRGKGLKIGGLSELLSEKLS
jgi:hypothetical protein